MCGNSTIGRLSPPLTGEPGLGVEEPGSAPRTEPRPQACFWGGGLPPLRVRVRGACARGRARSPDFAVLSAGGGGLQWTLATLRPCPEYALLTRPSAFERQSSVCIK